MANQIITVNGYKFKIVGGIVIPDVDGNVQDPIATTRKVAETVKSKLVGKVKSKESDVVAGL